MKMSNNPAFMTKRSRCTHVVAIACLLLFVQCNTQAKLSEEIEALKQQLQETNETNIGNLDTIIQEVRNEAQSSSTRQTQELGEIRTNIGSLDTTIQEVRNEAQNSSTQQTQELGEVRTNIRSLYTIIQEVRNEAQNSSTLLGEVIPLRSEVIRLATSLHELFDRLRGSFDTQENTVEGKDIVGDLIFAIYHAKNNLEAREDTPTVPLEVSTDTDNDAVSEVSPS
jgi:hypothetical protein